MWPKDSTDEALYHFDTNMKRMYRSDGCLVEINELYIQIDRISEKYHITLNSIVAEIYSIESRRTPLTQEQIDCLDEVP